MEFDVMTRATTWDNVATLARRTEAAGFSGMLFTEGHQVPWMNIAAAALAAPSLHFSTGIAIAFARSPMVTAEIAWELAQNTRGKFRLGLGSQVKALLANYLIVGPLTFEATNARFKRDTEVMLAVLKEIGLKPE